jgi:uncharacterized protein (DUF433 family)
MARSNVTEIDLFKIGRAYTIPEVAKLVGTTDSTVRRWIKGYTYEPQGRQMKPVFGEKDSTDGAVAFLSYLDMIEILVAVRFTQHGGKLDRVRDARVYAHKKWPKIVYPFASIRLKMMGGDLLHEFDEEHGTALSISLGTPDAPQYTLPNIVEDALDLQDFGPDVPGVVDPRFAGGQPTIWKRGVTVDTIARRFREGREKVASIARDLDLRARDVEEAIRFAKIAA